MSSVFDKRKNKICSSPSGVRGSGFPKAKRREECKRHAMKPKDLKEIWSGYCGHSKRLPASSFRAHKETNGLPDASIRQKRAQTLDYVMENRLAVFDQCQSSGRDSKYS